MLVGDYYAATTSGGIVPGKTYVVFGSNNPSAWGSGVVPLGSVIDGVRGFVLEGQAAGDINGDGMGDLLVGAR